MSAIISSGTMRDLGLVAKEGDDDRPDHPAADVQAQHAEDPASHKPADDTQGTKPSGHRVMLITASGRWPV